MFCPHAVVGLNLPNLLHYCQLSYFYATVYLLVIHLRGAGTAEFRGECPLAPI